MGDRAQWLREEERSHSLSHLSRTDLDDEPDFGRIAIAQLLSIHAIDFLGAIVRDQHLQC